LKEFHLKLKIRVLSYSDRHAESIAKDLFDNITTDQVRLGRKQLLAPGPDEVYSVCALHGSRVVGVCTGVRLHWFGERHRLEVVQVVVAESFRRQGVAGLMMREVANHFVKRGIEIIQVSSEGSNRNAIAVYKRLGFKEFGTLQCGLKYDDRYEDEVMMYIEIDQLLTLGARSARRAARSQC